MQYVCWIIYIFPGLDTSYEKTETCKLHSTEWWNWQTSSTDSDITRNLFQVFKEFLIFEHRYSKITGLLNIISVVWIDDFISFIWNFSLLHVLHNVGILEMWQREVVLLHMENIKKALRRDRVLSSWQRRLKYMDLVTCRWNSKLETVGL